MCGSSNIDQLERNLLWRQVKIFIVFGSRDSGEVAVKLDGGR
jgi:hypothetical protein